MQSKLGEADWVGSLVCLAVSLLITINARVAWYPMDKDLPRGKPQELGALGGPHGSECLEILEYLLA